MGKNDGGPAFPQGGAASPSGDVFVSAECGGKGMSLRDYAYIQFMAALLNNPGLCDVPDSHWFSDDQLGSLRDLAKYEADAMIAAREQE